MGFMNKLKFWKKKDPLADLERELSMGPGVDGMDPNLGMGRDELGMQSSDTGMPHDSWSNQPSGYPAQQYGHQQSQQYPTQNSSKQFQSAQQYERPTIVHDVQNENNGEGFGSKGYAIQKDIEVISAKLDALKAGIDAMNQRLATLEREIMHKRW
ncbi:MAG: hypothetical protein ABIG89_07405 [Candidatus Woesearchaeota archaeon]